MQDYSDLINDVVQPEIMETYFVKELKQLQDLFTADTNILGGPNIKKTIRTSVTSNATTFTKADADPEAGSFVTVDATWPKVYQHGAAEVSGIDISQAKNGGSKTITQLITDAIALEMEQLWADIYDAVYTQIKADVDSAAAYSGAEISRSSYPSLASYEENTNTAITLALLRTCSNTTRLNKRGVSKDQYLWVLQEKVYETFEPLAAALHTWNIYGEAGKPIDAGYQRIGNWEGTDVASPQGMTTGDVLFVRPRDVFIQSHLPVQIEQVPSGKFSAKFVIRTGVNGYAFNPGFQGKMTLKD